MGFEQKPVPILKGVNYVEKSIGIIDCSCFGRK